MDGVEIMAELDNKLHWINYWILQHNILLVCRVCGANVTIDYGDELEPYISPECGHVVS